MVDGIWLRNIALRGFFALLLLALPFWTLQVQAQSQGQTQTQPGAAKSVGQYGVSEGDPAREKAAYDAWFWGGETGSAATYRSICEKPQDRDYANLCQQWRLAEAAEAAAGWTMPALLLGAAGIIALLIAVALGGYAALAASRAAAAAGQAAQVSEKYSRIELRPYISINTIYEDLSMGPDGQPKEWLFSVEWQNTGKTPTKNMQSWAMIKYFPNDLPEGFDFPAPDLPAEYQGVLAAKARGRTRPLGLALEDIDAMARGKGKTYLWSNVEYGDVFDDAARHHTAIALEVFLLNPGIVRTGGVPFGFRPAKTGNHDS